MKLTTKVLLLTNAFSASVAFAPPRPHSSTTTRSQYQFKPTQPTQQPKSTTKLTLIPDPSTLESSSIQTSVADIVSTFGALALLGSVGFGVASGAKDDWDYEYKPGNEEAKLKYGNNVADLALMEVSPKEVAEDMVKVCVVDMYNIVCCLSCFIVC
jgi:hypothetical protein